MAERVIKFFSPLASLYGWHKRCMFSWQNFYILTISICLDCKRFGGKYIVYKARQKNYWHSWSSGNIKSHCIEMTRNAAFRLRLQSSDSSLSSPFNVRCPCRARVGRVPHIKPRLMMWFEAVFSTGRMPFLAPNPPSSFWLGTGTHNRWIAAHDEEIMRSWLRIAFAIAQLHSLCTSVIPWSTEGRQF